MLRLKLQYFGHLMRRADWFEKTLILGEIEFRRKRGRQRMRWLNGITDSIGMGLGKNSGSWWWTGRPGMLRSIGSQRVRHHWMTELNWTEWISKVEQMIVWTFLKGKICYMMIGLNKEILVCLQNCVFNTIFTFLFCARPSSRRVSLVAQLVKNPPALRETWVWSLGWEDSLEKRRATHVSILA